MCIIISAMSSHTILLRVFLDILILTGILGIMYCVLKKYLIIQGRRSVRNGLKRQIALLEILSDDSCTVKEIAQWMTERNLEQGLSYHLRALLKSGLIEPTEDYQNLTIEDLRGDFGNLEFQITQMGRACLAAACRKKRLLRSGK